MNDNIKTKKTAKRDILGQTPAVAGTILFAILGFFLSSPCMCLEGVARSQPRMIFYVIVLGRLLYGLLKRNLRLSDYLLWVGSFAIFYLLAEWL